MRACLSVHTLEEPVQVPKCFGDAFYLLHCVSTYSGLSINAEEVDIKHILLLAWFRSRTHWCSMLSLNVSVWIRCGHWDRYYLDTSQNTISSRSPCTTKTSVNFCDQLWSSDKVTGTWPVIAISVYNSCDAEIKVGKGGHRHNCLPFGMSDSNSLPNRLLLRDWLWLIMCNAEWLIHTYPPEDLKAYRVFGLLVWDWPNAFLFFYNIK